MTIFLPSGSELGQYLLGNVEGESLQAVVYKAYAKTNLHAPLVIKILKAGAGSIDQVRYLKQKIERLGILHDPRVSIPLRYEVVNDIAFIVQKWIPAIPLNDSFKSGTVIDLSVFFNMACSIVEILQVVHNSGIIHGGIKPHNILIQPDTLNPWLTDFISPLDIRDVSHFIYDPTFVRETLAYTSPEQTGRINHRVDFTSDLYSLGIVFYELLTGGLPFYSADPLEMIHSHLAEEGVSVNQVNPSIPAQLAGIVSKLIKKEPEKRYQSCGGLLADLIQCRDEFNKTGKISTFKLGLYDLTRRVIFISRMVGRDEEAAKILKQYEQVIDGEFRALFISGLSGIGKTRLIQELQKPLVKNRGYFTSGKFDQYQKNIPYSSLIQALRNLLRTFLTESDQQLAAWKQKIMTAIDSSGRVITDTLPELNFIIDDQPQVPDLPPVEARNRFNNVFGKFLACLASKQSPLILFIDDLQWCDLATFDFLQFIFANHEDYPFLYFMGAYRHNEVDKSHPLSKLIASIKRNAAPMEEIRITELDAVSTHEMVAYILDATLDETASLASFVVDLTEGNPLFISESLSYLYSQNLLSMDDLHHWQWDIGKIRDSQMPTSVVEMFSSKVHKLSLPTLQILEHCACMGNRFTSQDVCKVLDIDIHALFEDLKPVLSLGMLLENKNDLQFVHDRVQEAVLKNIDVQKRSAIHWRIGNRLLDSIQQTELVHCESLFTITSHLNQGKPQNLEYEKTWMLININYCAGIKALESLATEAANDFFRDAYQLLPEDCWQQNYALSFRIVKHLAKAELMCGRYQESEKLIDHLIEHAENDLDKTEALAEQTTSLSSVGNFIRAIATANRGLDYFGKAIPENAQEARSRMEILMTKIAAQDDVWRKILQMPFTEDRRSKIELSFYSELIPDLYMSGLVPQLYLSAAQSTLHCLEGGMDESVIYSFSIMGLNLGEQSQFDLAFRYQDLAHDLCERHPNTFGATKGMNGIVWCNMHSRSHPAEIVDYCYKAIQCGKNCGDLYNAGLAYGPLMWNLQVQGRDLNAVEEAVDECLHFSQKNQLSFSVGLAEAVLQGWVYPMKTIQYQPNMNIDAKITQWVKDNHIASAGSYFVLRGITQFYFGQYPEAEESFKHVHCYLDGLTDNVLKRQWMIFDALTQLRLCRVQHQDGLTILLETLTPKIAIIQAWSDLGPLLKPYFIFLQAELELTKGDRKQARNFYFDAIELAHGNCYVFLEGFLHQSLAEMKQRYCLGNFEMHYREAFKLYQECGAVSMESRLQTSSAWNALKSETGSPPNEITLQQSFVGVLPNIDSRYLMKSASAISAEYNIEQLLKKFMSILLEASGAQHGYLLLSKDHSPRLYAESHLVAHQELLFKSNIAHVIYETPISLPRDSEICRAIVNFALHTGEKVVLVNALEQGTFVNSPEVQTHRLRSVMCSPVFKQAEMIGLLYLENRLTEGAFTIDKIELIEMLSTHAAISIENARLLKETQRTQEKLQELNQTLEKRVVEEVNKNRDKDLLMIQQSRLAAMGEMIGNIAHQWRQPLNALALVLSNIKDAYQFNELNENYLEDSFEKGMRLIQKMSTTIGDFRDFFKSDKTKSIFSVKEQIMDAISLVDAAFKDHHIQIKIEQDEEIKLIGFPNEYSQVLLNLLSNAKDAISANHVDGLVILRIYSQDNLGCLAVFDNGGGVPEVILNKIFDPYFSTKAGGSGIGLYMSKMIIEQHMNGHLDVSNTPDGAVFTIRSPLAREN